MIKKTLISLLVKTDSDVVLARRRARQIAFLLGFDSQDQTRISTAVSEIARNTIVHADGGRLAFSLADKQSPCKFIITMEDKGPGIPDIKQILSGQSEHFGLFGASRLVDKFSAVNIETGGTLVQLEKDVPLRQKPFSDNEINEIANSLTKLGADNAVDEVHQQNQELLMALEQLSKKQEQIDQASVALAEKNQNLSEMNKQMQSLNNLLEKKVKERTHELMESNARLLVARDEAILANKLKSQFVANISHEIRTPMSGILSATELVLDDPNSINEESGVLIQMAHESAKHLMLILNDILDFAKLESGKSELKESQFCLAAVIAEALETVSASAKQKSLPINEDVPEQLKTKLLTGDAILMKRVLVNLVHNAVKFTHEGEVNVTVDSKVQNENILLIRTEVVDTGIGIADADMARLFQPFVQADGSNTRIYGGTGLGLSICSGYVRLMGGVMGVESTKNKGSKFWFEVPLKVASNE